MPEIVLDPGGTNELTLTEDDLAGRLNPVRTHTGIGDFSIDVVPNDALHDYAKTQDRINIYDDNSNVVFTGYVLESSTAESPWGRHRKATRRDTARL